MDAAPGTEPAAGDNTQQQADTQTSAAPAEYTDFTLPEGMGKDSTDLAALIADAKALNLDQAGAQKFLDREFARTKQHAENAKTAATFWATQAKEDKEFGGENLKQNLAVAERGLDAYGTPQLKQLLAATGLSNHPEIIRMLWKAGQTVKEDSIVNGGGAVNGARSTAQRLFPNMNP